MSIVGIGTDLIEIDRISATFNKFGDKFVRKILSKKEILIFHALPDKVKHRYLAKRFAAKEAVVKAFGTGFRNCGFKQINILNDALGKPYVELDEKAAIFSKSIGITAMHLSISDEKKYALAFVIASE